MQLIKDLYQHPDQVQEVKNLFSNYKTNKDILTDQDNILKLYPLDHTLSLAGKYIRWILFYALSRSRRSLF